MIKHNSLPFSTIFLFIVFSFFLVFITGCTKQVPKELLNTNKEQTTTGNQQMPNDSIHKNLMKQNTGDMNQSAPSSYADDSIMVAKLTKSADDADVKYQKSKSEADKKNAVETQLAAANFLMFKADNFSPAKKYRPALKRYRRVLEIDPANQEAASNKQQIEDIYKSLGKDIPND